MTQATKIRLISCLQKIVVTADFKTVEKKFIEQGIPKDEVKKALDTFKELRDKHRITKPDEKNIDFWGKKDFSDFQKFVNITLKTSSKTSVKKDTHKKHDIEGADFITMNDDWIVYRINDYKASELLGSREWCIVRGEEDFESHSKKMNFYYLLSKNRDKEDKWYKIAMGVDTKNKKLYWDNFDEPRPGAPSIPLKELNIPKFKDTYEFRIRINGKSYTEEEFVATNGLTVKGDLDLSYTQIKALPDNLKVDGYLDLSYTQIKALPDNLKVDGYLDLSYAQIEALPDNLTVRKSLDLQGTKIKSLPDNLKVSELLDLSYTQIESLPDNLTVSGLLDLSYTQIESLPDNLTVGDLFLCNTPIKALPDNLTVGGIFNLAFTQIKSLPDNFKVGRDLDLGYTQLKALPDNLTVGGNLDLRNTPLKSLPDNLTVGKNLDLRNSQIKSLPASLKVGGDIIGFKWAR